MTEKAAGTPLPSQDDVSARRRMVFVLFLICTMNFADRAVFSALAQTIKIDLKLSDLQLGLLQGLVFALLYAVVGLPIGLLAERHSRKRIIAIATTIWSAATAATGLAGGFTQLAFARLTVGMGEAGFVPPAASMVADMVPRQKRASTFSLVMLGTPVGTFFGATLAGLAAATWHWRTAFFVFALPGFILALVLLLLVKEPVRGQIDQQKRGSESAPSFATFLRTVAGNRPLLWVIAGGSLAGFGMSSISQFLAIFLARTYHLGVREAAASFGTISGAAIAIGLLVGSFGTDYLARRDPRWPAWGAAFGLACAPPLYWMAFNAETLPTSFTILLFAGAFLLMFYGPTAAMIQNLLPSRMRASGVALYTLLYTICGYGLGPVFVGAMSDFTASRSYAGDYLTACPHGLPPEGASAALEAACRQASTGGLQYALSSVVLIFFVSAFCFLRAAPGLRREAMKESAQTSA